MTTTNSNAGTNNSKQRMIAIAAIIVVALLTVNAFLLYNKFTQDKKLAQQATELEEAEKLKAELEKQYYEALSELETMRGENEELNALIEQQQAELKDQKDKIDRMIRNEGDLKRARTEIANLKAQIEQYIAEITQLKEENQLLADENTQLQEDKAMLETDLTQQRTANEELNTEKAQLVSANEDLSKTVTFASVVKVDNIEAVGLKVKDNGKTAKKSLAKNVDQLQVCFNTTINEVTTAGREQFFVRIINPVGETIAIEEQGSGIMTSSQTNEQIRYTQVKELNYNNDKQEVCFSWESTLPFQKGTYEVEIYNKGYLAGTGNFTLK
ncbi:MAG: hypothetical protein KDC43_20760 [Saprospiraceae bacterium]|nr:hypothetical protein [Saprospiraceae bacterium]MCB0626277.1 hypothetical protein [Saprospiraceae bacterium]MCB0675383.1 hypothetical protein [Saprospiraceae bacterium]MCB0680309.1 hypothetical protein [Saprospiraceae bacterium]